MRGDNMKKYMYMLTCVAISFILLVGCRKEDDSYKISDMELTTYETVNNFTDVSMTIKEETVSTTGLTVVFENNSDNRGIYGEFFSLEEKINNKWYQVPVTIDGYYGFNEIGYNLISGENEEFKVDWEWLYGSLNTGEYRIVKDILDFRNTGDFDRYYLAAEFTILN